ncbi:MAG: tripartite tricarboxylate transporter substrate binding protein [Burkholderiales bacterium]|nr:tripartite tricarboxylate transporter substrate binding protein [Burkholderiales bacterium]
MTRLPALRLPALPRPAASRRARGLLALLGAAVLATGAPLAAQTWPDRPVKVYVSTAAGSAPDIVTRLITDQLGQLWGKALVVDNRPGAGGNLGAQATAKSPGDGYTLWFAHATPVVMNQYLFKAPGFDAERDFVPIVRIGINPMMISVNAGLPAADLKALIALAKSRPDRLSFATSGSKNIPHLVGETLNQTQGTGMVHVPYKGSQQAAQDTASGQTQVYIDAVPPMVAWLQGGRLRALAVTTRNRLPGFEQVPTAAEMGADLVMAGWVGVLAPAGTPREVVERVNRDVNTVLARADIAARLRALGTYELGGTQRDFDAFISQERRLWERVVQMAKIERE